MNLKKIRQIAIAANDLDESESFYRDTLGATLIARYEPPGLLFFDFESVRLLIEKGAMPSTIYFWVDDIDAAHQALVSAGVVFEGEPHMIFPDADGTFGPAGEEEWMCFFKDPAENMLALATRKPQT